MTVFLRCFLLSTLVLCALPLPAQQTRKTQNVIILTVDGLRWQELFGGVDSALVHDVKFSPLQSGVAQDFWAASPAERRRKLLPFFWDSIAPRAVVLGDRQRLPFGPGQTAEANRRIPRSP